MTLLTSFPENLSVAVVGTSGGIGSEFVRRLQEDDRVTCIHSLSRNPSGDSTGKVIDRHIDICDEESINAAAAEVSATGKLDLVVVATGILHRGEVIQPEKSLRDIEPGAMMDVFRINAIGPALVAKAFLPHMRPGTKSVFAALSARVGSISDNRLGGWASYRASKAALNMLVRTFSIEQSRNNPGSLVVTLHPGTTDTALSKPFQRNVPKRKLFTPDFVAERLLSVLDGLGPGDSGGFFAWDGSRIEY